MIRHLLKLVWNRKGANALVLVEIFISFLVVFVVATLGLHLWRNYKTPLGFEYRDVWVAAIDMPAIGDLTDPATMATFERLRAEAEALPPVIAAAGGMTAPYGREGWVQRAQFGGVELDTELGTVTLGYDRVFGLAVAAGRFFEEADRALAWKPVVINRRLAEEIYGAADPLGQRFGDPRPDSKEPEMRVVGVVEEFRKEGELGAPGNFTFTLLDPPHEGAPRKLVLLLRPGTPASFEEELARRLQAVAPDWSFEIQPLRQMRAGNFRERLTPLLLGGIVAVFLMLMVGLGLIGVLWQNLLQRTREVGLRRAVGAARGDIHRQVLFELWILAGFGVLLGVLVAAQLPLLGVASFLLPSTIAGGIVLAMAAIFLLAALCALYPSLQVSRIQPAEALRYE